MTSLHYSSESGEHGVCHCSVCGTETSAETDHEVHGDPNVDPAQSPCHACGHRIWFDWAASGTSLTIRLGGLGIVTEQNLMRVLGRIDQEVRSRPGSRVFLDFGPVGHITSTAIAQLVGLKRRLDAEAGQITLKVPLPELQDIFRITRLDSVFSFAAEPHTVIP